MFVRRGLPGVVEHWIVGVVTWETDGWLTLLFATIIHSGHNIRVKKRENISALGETMGSVVIDIHHVLTKVTKSIIWDSSVI